MQSGRLARGDVDAARVSYIEAGECASGYGLWRVALAVTATR